MTDIRQDYAAINRLGRILITFNDLAMARAWVRERAAEHDGLHVAEITVTTTIRPVYRPRLSLVRAA